MGALDFYNGHILLVLFVSCFFYTLLLTIFFHTSSIKTQSLNFATFFILSSLSDKIMYLLLDFQKITISSLNLKFPIYTTYYFFPYFKYKNPILKFLQLFHFIVTPEKIMYCKKGLLNIATPFDFIATTSKLRICP